MNNLNQVGNEAAVAEVIAEDPIKMSLTELLDLLKIKKVYYVDDEHVNDIDFEIISVTLTEILNNGKAAELRDLALPGLNLDLPEEEVNPIYKTSWIDYTLEQKKTSLQSLFSLNDDSNYQFDITRAQRIKDLFPDGLLVSVSPQEWDEVKDTIDQNIGRSGKVLVFFDQDLRGAGGKFLVTKGENLIKEIKEKPFRNRIICTLLTHLIPNTGGELLYRQTVLTHFDGQLKKGDFFALTKVRIDDNALLSDGVKKVLLNKFCEFIKDKSIRIMKTAYGKVVSDIKNMDTYDFDHTVLRSSYEEGVWEAETLFRISRNLYDLEVKKLMIAKSYPARVNKQIKQAKAISDIRFRIGTNIEPYTEKYKLRSHDIYEPGSVIGPLHLPLENGDIFEVTTGKHSGKYILVAQECDLMMRTNPLGTRSAKLATLLPITSYNTEALRLEMIKHFNKFVKKNHFLSNRFQLDYFNYGTNDIGIVNLGSAIIADLDVLDLVVFNPNGNAQMNIESNFNINLVSTSWEHRYYKLHQKYKDEATLQKSLINELPKVLGQFRDKFKSKIYSKISTVKDLGPLVTFDNVATFSFGIKRIMRLKPVGAKYLLDRYYKHLSRVAEQHDFADEG